jgi:hypothetical protein
VSDRVIIIDIRRGNTDIPIHEIKQACGRVGRKHTGQEAFVDIVLPCSEQKHFQKEMEAGSEFFVKSVLQEADELPFHVISEIVNGVIQSKDDINTWHKRSLDCFQGNKIAVEKVVKKLKEAESVTEVGNSLHATALGKIASKMYFTPLSVFEWKTNFDLIFQRSLESDIFAVSWALANTSFGNRRYNPYGIYYLIEEYKDQVSSLNVDYEGAIISGILWWYMLGGPSIKSLISEVGSMQNDFPRILTTLRKIDEDYAHWDRPDFWDDLEVMVRHRIPAYLVPLCKLNGISKTSAMELYNMDIKCLGDMRERLSDIEGIGNLKLLNDVKKLLREIEQ